MHKRHMHHAPLRETAGMDPLTELARALVPDTGRAMLGIVGPPGVGKSSVVERIVAELGSPFAMAVPMVGFHLSNRVLDDLGLRDRKGAIETFDGDGFVALIERLRSPGDAPVLAPAFDRTLDEPVAASIQVTSATRLVITEGNYLLDESEPWTALRRFLDAIWYLDLDDEIRRARLRVRHERFGRSPEDAANWVMTVDEPNARRVAACRYRADRVIAAD